MRSMDRVFNQTRAARDLGIDSAAAFEPLEPRLLLSSDLTGSIVSVSLPVAPGTTTAGTDFVAVVNITNLGSSDVDGSISVAFWLTQDGIIDGTNDFYAGHETINLHDLPSGGGTVGLTADSLHVPSATTSGNYFLVSLIDSKGEEAESNEANNWIVTPYASPYAIVGGGGTGRDLTGTIVSTSLPLAPAAATAGDDFVATVNITNLGSKDVSESISVSFWVTQDGIIDGTNDVYVGHETITLHSLPTNGVVGLTADSLHLPSTTPVGNYFLLALIDSKDEVVESNEANNWIITPYASPYAIVGGGATGRDLTGTIVSTSLPLAPAAATAGDDFVATVNITNLGGKDVSESISVSFWMTQDGIIDGTNDVYVGHETITLHSLPTNGVVGLTADSLHLPSTTPVGNYFLVALIDSKGEVAESNEANNWIVTPYSAPYAIVGGGATGRDLTGNIVSVSLPVAPGTSTAGDDFVAVVNITNLGGKDVSESISVSFWMTQDGIIDGTNDVYVGHETISLHSLPTNGVVGLTADGLHLPSSTPVGNYFLVALIDSKGEVAESNEANNWIASSYASLFNIVGGGSTGKDLIGTILSHSLPGTVVAGYDFVATVNITNLGSKDVDESISVAFWLTQDGIIDGTNDVYVGHESINLHELPQNGVVGLTADGLHLPSTTAAGTYYLLALTDSYGEVAESNEANNWTIDLTMPVIVT